jgi:TPR repeat protein
MERNLENAYRWYRKAAEDGLAYGQFNLGRCYGNGWGAAKDLSQAAFWYQRCAPPV